MTTITIYCQLDPTKATDRHHKLETSGGPIYIRAYTRHCEKNLETGLLHAVPHDGELVLACIPAPNQPAS